jgi:hypothetical protein
MDVSAMGKIATHDTGKNDDDTNVKLHDSLTPTSSQD